MIASGALSTSASWSSGFPAHVAPGAGQAGVDAGAGVPAEASAEQALHAPRCRIQLLPLQNVPQRHHHLRVVEGLVLGGACRSWHWAQGLWLSQ